MGHSNVVVRPPQFSKPSSPAPQASPDPVGAAMRAIGFHERDLPKLNSPEGVILARRFIAELRFGITI